MLRVVKGETGRWIVARERGRALRPPRGREEYISRALGTRVDGEATERLPVGAIIQCYASCGAVRRGVLRLAVLASPFLIVEEGASWHGTERNGPYEVDIRVDGARPISPEELEHFFRGG